MDVREDTVDGFRQVTLHSEEIEVSVLPELGGKLRSLRLAGHPHNVLLEPPEFRYRRASTGAAFEAFDTSGFDECFPTVAASTSPDDSEVALPDHGFLWTSEWTCEPDDAGLRMEARLPGQPWRFTRQLRISGRTLRLEYELASQAQRPLRYLWSAHPLLAASVGSSIHLPSEVRAVFVQYSRGDRVGRHGAEIGWPHPGMDVLRGPETGWAEKLFTPRLAEGWCAFHHAASGVWVRFRFDPQRTPYLGLWICQGGWPESRVSRHFTVALEPTSGRPDALAEAAHRGECARLEAGETSRWALEIELGQAPIERSMEKRSIRLPDGRTLIFYTFPDPAPPQAREPPTPPVRRRDDV